jgi:ABC-type multidrug transport system ATPase subunit
MEMGKVVAVGTLDQLNQSLVPHRLLHIKLLDTAPLAEAQTALANTPGVTAVRVQENGRADWLALEAEFNGDDAAMQALLADLIQRGLPIVHFSEEMKNLEEVFMRATKGIVS